MMSKVGTLKEDISIETSTLHSITHQVKFFRINCTNLEKSLNLSNHLPSLQEMADNIIYPTGFWSAVNETTYIQSDTY